MYSVHVVPHRAGDGKWLVEVTGQEEKQTFPTQAEAIRAARQLAKDNQGEQFVHNRHGQIEDRSGYGHDPRGRG